MGLPFDFSATTGLRGVACLVVVVGNYLHFYAEGDSDPKEYRHVSLDYHTAVSLFFVLSGVLLSVLYKGKLENNWGTWFCCCCCCCSFAIQPANLTFYKKRFARIIPLYWFALVIFLPVWILTIEEGSWLDDGETPWLAPLASITMTRSIFPWAGAGQFMYIAPLWTVSAFMVCYLYTPAILAWVHPAEEGDSKWRPRFALLVITLVYLLQTWAVLMDPTGGDMRETSHIWAPCRVGQFAAGMYVGSRLDLLAAYFKERTFAACALVEVCSAIFFVIWWVMIGFNFLGRDDRIYYEIFWVNAFEFVTTPVQIIFVAMLSLGGTATANSLTVKVLKWKPLTKVGDWSYAIYVIHTIVFTYWGELYIALGGQEEYSEVLIPRQLAINCTAFTNKEACNAVGLPDCGWMGNEPLEAKTLMLETKFFSTAEGKAAPFNSCGHETVLGLPLPKFTPKWHILFLLPLSIFLGFVLTKYFAEPVQKKWVGKKKIAKKVPDHADDGEIVVRSVEG